MKFVCDKCKTKYSIADEKVRRKVLKIRCKNCANIIVVRDPSRQSESGIAARGTDALEQAFDGAFSSPAPSAPAPAPRGRRGSSGFRPLAAVARASSPELVADDFIDEDEADRTRLSSPEYRPGEEPEDEWYLTVDAHQFGPMSFEELGSRVKRGEARGDDAYVWRDGFDDWIDVARVPELRPFAPPPPPPSRSGLFPVSDIDSKLPPAPVPPLPGFDRAPAGAGAPRPTGPVGQRSATPLPAPMPPPPRAPMPPPRPPAPTIPQGMVATPTPAPPPPTPAQAPGPAALAAPAPDFGPVPAFDAAISQLPAAYGDRPDLTMPPVMPTGGAKTPALIKVAAIAGILSTLTGIAILVYFLAFDRPAQRAQQPTLAQLTAQTKQPAKPTPAPAPVIKPDAGNVQLEFPPVDVDRSPKGAVRHRKGTRPVAKRPVAKQPTGKKLTAAQRRLLERMGGQVGAPAVPHTTGGQRRRGGPSRNISGNEIGRLQRINHSALKACYQRSLKRDDSLKELKAVIQINVVPSGVVRSVSISGVSDFQLRTCLQRNVKRWTFKPLGGSETKTIEFSMSFRGS